MTRFSQLDDVLAHVWEALDHAANDPSHAFRRLTFGTAQAGRPNLRTVVLRETEATERRLLFHTDRRSKKVEEIRSTDRIAWHGWDAEARQQIRLFGSATVHRDDAVSAQLWEAEEPEALSHYVRPNPPGTPLDAPEDGVPERASTEPLSRDDVADGRQHFAVVRTQVDQIDWLHLHPDEHYRAFFQYEPERQQFVGKWVVP